MPDRFSRRSVSTIEADDDDRPSPPRSCRGCGREHAPGTLIQLLKELSRSQQIHGFESFHESAKYQSERLTRRRYLTLPMSQARAGGDAQFPGKCVLRSCQVKRSLSGDPKPERAADEFMRACIRAGGVQGEAETA